MEKAMEIGRVSCGVVLLISLILLLAGFWWALVAIALSLVCLAPLLGRDFWIGVNERIKKWFEEKDLKSPFVAGLFCMVNAFLPDFSSIKEIAFKRLSIYFDHYGKRYKNETLIIFFAYLFVAMILPLFALMCFLGWEVAGDKWPVYVFTIFVVTGTILYVRIRLRTP